MAVVSVLAAACVLLALTAPLAVTAMYGVINTVSPVPWPAPTIAAQGVWLTAPNGIAQVSPLLILFLLGAVILVGFAAVRARGLNVRHADTWGCGRIRQTPRMEYTSTAFAEPLRRIFTELYQPTQDLSISTDPDSRYVVRSITYTSQIVPWFEKAFYDPVIHAVRALATQVRRLQAGSVHLYLLYVAGALLVALASAWWFQ